MTTFSPFSDETLHELNLPLNPDRVTVGQNGPLKDIPYLTGEDVTRRANEVFGYGNWGFELIGAPTMVERGAQGNNSTEYEVWMAYGRLNVRNAMPVSDVGTCVRQGKGSGGLEMAVKGAATDAMKRCLRQLGDQFGLVLYDKETSGQELRQQWNAATAEPRQSATDVSEGDRALYQEFFAQCRGLGITTKPICEALGFTPDNADAAAEFLAKSGAGALKKWLEDNPDKGWQNLVSRLADQKAAAK